MNTPELLRSIPRAYANVLPAVASGEAAKAGEDLRAQYKDCAQGFRAIVRIAGPKRRMDGALVTPLINLGVRTHDTFGDVQCTAQVCLSEYNPGSANERKSAFWAMTHFMGQQAQGGKKVLGIESFGARGCNMLAMRMPTFVRIPDSTMEAPWDQAESERYDYDGNSYPWDQKNYRVIHKRLWPMMERALNTQEMLLEAMCDPELNPQFADAVADLTVVRNRLIAA